MTTGHEEEDASLFGSPPPSPGRSPSPALALPTRGFNNPQQERGDAFGNHHLNVGTIALPGSQPSSELFVNPLAHSLAYPPQLPPKSKTNAQRTHKQTVSQSTIRTRQSSSRPSTKKKKEKARSTTPKPHVEISLPDPSAPVPPNFLRRQTALLGVAGLVAGVNPTQLTLRGQTPTNPIVIEEDENRGAPTPAKTPAQPKKQLSMKQLLDGGLSKETQTVLKGLDPAEIPVPTKDEILAVLVKEKDITPIIQGLIKLGMDAQGRMVSASSQPSLPPGSRATWTMKPEDMDQPPSKRRKVVPAGAGDWDVPYPFPEGEGPASYHKSWKNERGKQLIAQLVELTKVASRKAAMQKLLQAKGIKLPVHSARSSNRSAGGSASGSIYYASGGGEVVNGHYKSRGHYPAPASVPEGERVNKYYKPITATYGLGMQRPPFIAENPANANPPPTSSTSSSGLSQKPRGAPTSVPPSKEASPSTPEPPSQEVQDFISSLLGMTNQQRVGHHTVEPSSDDHELFTGFDSSAIMQDDIFADWGTTYSTHSADPSAAFAPSSSTPPHLDPLLSVGDLGLFSGFGDRQTPTDGFVDSNIDPDLLGMGGLPVSNALGDVFGLPGTHLSGGMPLAIKTQGDFFGGGGAGAASPNSSVSPFTGGPATPASAEWEMSLPEVFIGAPPTMGSQDVQQGMETGVDMLEGWDALEPLGKFVNADVERRSTGDFLNGSSSGGGEGALQEVEVQSAEVQSRTTADHPRLANPAAEETSMSKASSAANLPPSEQPFTYRMALSPSESQPPAIAPTTDAGATSSSRAPAKSKIVIQKEETIQRIKERKAELEAELRKVKLQLWETTIEQGALGHVIQLYQEKENESQLRCDKLPISAGDSEARGEDGQVLAVIDNALALS